MKRNFTGFCILFILQIIFSRANAQTPTDGDYRSFATGNWNSASTWQVRTSGIWSAAIQLPTATNNVYIQNGHTVTLNTAVTSADGLCNDLHINSSGILAISGSNNILVSGKIRAYTGASEVSGVDGSYAGTSSTSPSGITTTSTGILKFIGVTRNITNTGEWNSTGISANAEFALNAGSTGTLLTGIKFKKITISACTVTTGSFIAVGTNAADFIRITSGARLISSRSGVNSSLIGGSSATKCGIVQIDEGGVLELTGTTPTIDCTTFANNGTVLYSRTGTQALLAPTPDAAADGPVTLPNYCNLILSGSSAKNIPAGLTVTVSNAFTLGGSASAILAAPGGGSLVYGAGATFVDSSSASIAITATSLEWPATNGPTHVRVISNILSFTAGAGISRTIPGSLTLNGGSFTTNTGNTLTFGNGSTIYRSAAVSAFNLSGGTVLFGTSASDLVNLVINSGTTLSTGAEFPSSPSPGKFGTLTIGASTTYSITTSRTVTDLNNTGVLNLAPSTTLNFTLSGAATGTGVIKTGTVNAASLILTGNGAVGNIYFDNSNPGSTNAFNQFTLNRTGGGSVNFNGNVSFAGTVNLTAGTLFIGSNTLTANGAITGSGTFTGSSASNLVIGGTAGTLRFASGSSLNNLTLSSGSSATLGTALDVYGAITLTTASLNLNAQNLALKSNTTNTARIANLTGSTLTGASNVTMERWIKLRTGGDGRAYRLLTPTVNTTGSIQANWMEGGMNTTIGTNVNLVPLFGTQITGAGGNANGFDKTQSNAASLYLATNAVTPTYNAVGSTSGTLNALTGYFMYIRGDRSMDMTIPLAPNMPTSSTTLRATGTVVQGTQTAFTNPYAGGGALNLVTNPYPSPIDWSLVRAASSGITDSYTFWDPNFGTRGGFVTVTTGGVASSGLATQYIQPGQAFFVESDGGTPAISIQEGHKVANNNNEVFLTPPPPVEGFRTELYFTEPNGYRRVVDGVIAVFNNSYSAAVDNNDAREISNWDENIAINRETKHLAIESRPVILSKDTIPLFMNKMKQQAYEFEFTPAMFSNPNLKAELVDKFLGTRTLLSVADPITVSFTVTADAASAAADRFMVVFGSFSSPPAIDAITIKASQKNNGVLVEWTSETETGMLRYEVERSVFGTGFAKVNTAAAAGNSSTPVSYNWFDANPINGTGFYRVKAIDRPGNIKYSDIVKLTFGKGEPGIVVYPNPMEGRAFKIDMNNLVKGNYVLNLYNSMGQLVYTEQLQHDGSQATKTINLNWDMGKGAYQLQLGNSNGFKTTQTLIKN
jgi:Secretion system C-terminal sorting domain